MHLKQQLIFIVFIVFVDCKNNHFESPFELNNAIDQISTRLRQLDHNLNNVQDIWSTAFDKRSELAKLFNDDNYYTSKQPSVHNISVECSAEVRKLLKGLSNREIWSIRVFDSWGKPPSGILEGSVNWLGEYVECMNSSSLAVNWTAKYCSVSTDKANHQDANNFKISFTYGLCVPFVCSQEDIAAALNYIPADFLFGKNFTFDSNNVVCQEPKQLDSSAKIALIVLLTIMFVILIATVIDIYRLYIHNSIFKTEIRNIMIQINDDSVNPSEIESLLHSNFDEVPMPHQLAIMKLIPCLSIVRNTRRIFNLSVDKNQLQCLHAFRFLTLAWIILGHSIGFIAFYTDNIAIIPDYIRSFSMTFITNGFLSVDTFFLMSGILGSFMFLKESSKPNFRLSFVFFFKHYLHRFIRISPPYMIVLMISILLSKYFGQGPLFPVNGYEPVECKQNWWRNLLYINNFFKSDEMCLSVSWYLSNDMQFHWFAPILLIPFALGKFFIAIIFSTIILVASISSIMLLLYFNPDAEVGIFGNNSKTFSELVYLKPWSRIGPFVVGIILGCLIYVKKTQMRSKINIALNNSLWLSAICLGFLCVFGLYPDFRQFPSIYFSRWTHIIYQSFSRVLWALSLSYIIYACETSNGGIVNRVLTWRVWLPFSRLTYSAYLIHLTVIFYFNTTQQHLFHWQNSTLVYYFMSNLVFSYVTAYFVCVFFELPLIGLEKFIMKRNNYI